MTITCAILSGIIMYCISDLLKYKISEKEVELPCLFEQTLLHMAVSLIKGKQIIQVSCDSYQDSAVFCSVTPFSLVFKTFRRNVLLIQSNLTAFHFNNDEEMSTLTKMMMMMIVVVFGGCGDAGGDGSGIISGVNSNAISIAPFRPGAV